MLTPSLQGGTKLLLSISLKIHLYSFPWPVQGAAVKVTGRQLAIKYLFTLYYLYVLCFLLYYVRSAARSYVR